MARALVGALLAVQAAASIAPALSAYANDFLNYYLPARAVLEGRPLDRAYERLWMAAEAERAGLPSLGLFMPNPPANALLLLPLAGLSPLAAKAVWTLLLVAALIAAHAVLARTLAAPPWILALPFLVLSSALANALAYGPPYALLLLLLAGAFAAASRGRDFTCGLLLGPVVALKLYSLVLLPYFLWRRRWPAAAGLVVSTAAVTAATLLVLGPGIHAVYLREMLPASLDGRIIDPYSPFWQTLHSMARRLFQSEPELNPWAVADWPGLAAFLARAAAVLVPLATILGTPRAGPTLAVARDWAALLLAASAVSPMTASYHLVLLVLPCALLIAEPGASWRRMAVVLALLAFAGSPLPHLFNPLARGWGNLAACPRLCALLALWALAAAPLLRLRPMVVAAAAAMLASLVALPPREPDVEWTRMDEAAGPLLAEPVDCGGRLFWVAPEKDGYAVRGSDGSRRRGASVHCSGNRVSAERAVAAMARGLTADRPRVSPDGRWTLQQQWRDGSWDVVATDRDSGRAVVVAGGPAHETEPSWSSDGRRIWFLSDRRRGLFFAAVYSAPFVP